MRVRLLQLMFCSDACTQCMGRRGGSESLWQCFGDRGTPVDTPPLRLTQLHWHCCTGSESLHWQCNRCIVAMHALGVACLACLHRLRTRLAPPRGVTQPLSLIHI